MPRTAYADNVFINCPFDRQYRSLFDAMIFAVFDCGYVARCTTEIDDASQVRIDKIAAIIKACKYGIHDISRTKLDRQTGLPRFNMPLELGIFLGAKRFGHGEQRHKVCLILDEVRYRYQSFISDIAGQDIRSHGNDPQRLVTTVRNWLRTSSKRTTIPGGEEIWRRYQVFRKDLPLLCKELRLLVREIVFNDYTNLVSVWLEQNA